MADAPSLSQFFENCESIVVDYQSDIQQLPPAPDRLMAALSRLGRAVA